MKAMKLIYRIVGFYQRARLILWLAGIAGGILAPAVGYVSYLFDVGEERRTMLADSPEYASDVRAVNVWDWLAGAVSDHVNVLGVVALVGVVFISLLIVLQVVSFVKARTELSGTDRESEDAERARDDAARDAGADDPYGRVDEY